MGGMCGHRSVGDWVTRSIARCPGLLSSLHPQRCHPHCLQVYTVLCLECNITCPTIGGSETEQGKPTVQSRTSSQYHKTGCTPSVLYNYTHACLWNCTLLFYNRFWNGHLFYVFSLPYDKIVIPIYFCNQAWTLPSKLFYGSGCFYYNTGHSSHTYVPLS